MNKKGFAVSTMLYGLVFVTLAVFYLIISIIVNRQQTNTNYVTELRDVLQVVRSDEES